MTRPLELRNAAGGVLHFGFRSPMLSEELDYAGKVALAREVGASILEPQLVEREFKNLDGARLYRELAAAASIAIPTAGCELGLATPQEQSALVARTQQAADYAQALGANYLFSRVMPPADPVPQAETWETIRQQCRLVCQVLQDAGIAFAIEADGPSFVPSLERMERVLQCTAHPNCYANYDPTNLYLGGSDPLLAIEKLGSRILSGHIKDGIFRIGNQREVPVGTGDIDYSTIIRRLLELGRPINLYVEHCKTADQVRSSFVSLQNILASLAP